MLLELGWLVRVRGWRVGPALLRLGPGALMVVAIRAALTGGGWPAIALPLLLSFPLHLADLLREKDRPGAVGRRADPPVRRWS